MAFYGELLLYYRRFENKIFRFILSPKLYARYSWNREQAAAAWYKADLRMKSENLSRPEYAPFFEELSAVLKGKNTLGIDLGCGTFRVTKALIDKIPDANYLGIDFSDYAINAYKELSGKHNNIDFVYADINNLYPWTSHVKQNYNNYKIAACSFGVLEYFSENELKNILSALYNLDGLTRVCFIEPAGWLNLDLVESVRSGSTRFHNYRKYLTEAGFNVKRYSYLFDNEYVFIVADK